MAKILSDNSSENEVRKLYRFLWSNNVHPIKKLNPKALADSAGYRKQQCKLAPGDENMQTLLLNIGIFGKPVKPNSAGVHL